MRAPLVRLPSRRTDVRTTFTYTPGATSLWFSTAVARRRPRDRFAVTMRPWYWSFPDRARFGQTYLILRSDWHRMLGTLTLTGVGFTTTCGGFGFPGVGNGRVSGRLIT